MATESNILGFIGNLFSLQELRAVLSPDRPSDLSAMLAYLEYLMNGYVEIERLFVLYLSNEAVRFVDNFLNIEFRIIGYELIQNLQPLVTEVSLGIYIVEFL